MKKTIATVGFALLLTSMAYGQLGTANPTNSVSVSVAAEAALVLGGDVALTSSGSNFADYTGTTNFTYFIRTGAASGSGTVDLKVTSDFSGTGGPSVSTPLSGTDKLAYLNTVSAPG